MNYTAEELCDWHKRNLTDRQPLEWIYRDCYALTVPIRGARWSTGGVQSSQKGAAEASFAAAMQADLLDETGADAARILAAALKDGGAPSSSQWLGLAVNGADDAGELWLDKSATTLWRMIHDSTFDAVSFEALHDAVIGGQFVLYVDEDNERGGFTFEQWQTADCTWARSKAGGPIDMIWREVSLTAQQAVAEYGAAVGTKITELASTKPGDPVIFLRCIYPRKGPHGRFALNMPFASVTLVKDEKRIVKESGYPWFPCIVPRWMVQPGSEYAVGPAYTALPALRQLNKVIDLQLLGLEVHAGAGTYKARDDGVFNPRTVRLGSRRVIVVGDMDNLQPLAKAGDLQSTLLDIERLQRAIRKVFQADALEPQDTGTKTATEIQIRVDMIRQQLGPMYGRLQAEFLKPLVELCFAIALARGAFEPVPRSLAGKIFNVEFESPLARAQRLSEVHAIDQYVAGTLADMQIDPGVVDNADMMTLNRLRAERLGVPRQGLRDEGKIREMRAMRERQQRSAQAEALQGLAAQAADARQPRTAATAATAAQSRLVAA